MIFLIYSGADAFHGYLNHALFGNFFISTVLIQFLIFLAIPFFFSFLILKGYKIAKSIYIPVLAIFIVFYLIAAIYIYNHGINIIESVNFFSVLMTKKLMYTYAKMGMKYFTTAKMQALISKTLKIILFLLPSILIIFSWMSIWICFVFLKKISKKTNLFFYGLKENLLLWRSSDYFLLVPITGIIISIFSVGIFKFIGYNIILLASSVYLIQGLTIISYFFGKFNINVFLRILGYAVIFIFSNPLIIFIILTGIFDMWFNFRKIDTNKKEV
ncbi:MAG: YybS family protein [Deltaproteobacteria bacterium]|nr:YybS family protein [Deltaproteobacteria bacterium]MCL6120389.1 YybS family protein [Deltaproteobacteria bacterium]